MHFAVVDGLHAHKTRAVYDVIDSATGARSQPLILMITTAGHRHLGHLLRAARLHRERCSRGAHVDGRGSASSSRSTRMTWRDPAVWRKGQPNLGVSVKTDDMAAAVRKAQAMPSALNNVLTKQLNRWVNADSAWMPIGTGSAAATPSLQLDDFGGERCWIGMDPGRSATSPALALVFKRSDQFFLFTRLYLNELAISESGQRTPAGLGARRLMTGHRQQCHRLRRDRRRPAQLLQTVRRAGDPYDPAMSRYFA